MCKTQILHLVSEPAEVFRDFGNPVVVQSQGGEFYLLAEGLQFPCQVVIDTVEQSQFPHLVQRCVRWEFRQVVVAEVENLELGAYGSIC